MTSRISTHRKIHDNIKYMIRYFKRWLILKKLSNECRKYRLDSTEEFLLNDGKILIDKTTFLKQITEKLKDNPQKKQKKIDLYNSLIDSCIDVGYIEEEIPKDAIDKEGKPAVQTTSKGEDMLALINLIEDFLKTYPKIFTLIFSLSGILWIFGKYIYNFIATMLNLPKLL